MDGGTTANILRGDAAKVLLAAGYVHRKTTTSHNSIHFGRGVHPEPVQYLVEGPKHVGEILVVDNMDATMLISEINFTNQPNTYIVKNYRHAYIIQGGIIIIKGDRVPTATIGTNETLYQIRLTHLLRPLSVHPRNREIDNFLAKLTSGDDNLTAHSARENVGVATWSEDLSEGVATDPVVIPPNLSLSTSTTSTNPILSSSFSSQAAKVSTYSRAQYVDARAIIRNSNNTSGYALAKTLEVGGWRDPPDIPPQLLRAISKLHDNIPQEMALSKKVIGVGSGIPLSVRPFQHVYGDVLGKWATDISGSTQKMFMCEGYALYSEVYALDDKTAGADAIVRFDRFAHECGWWIERVYFDAASEVSQEYIDRLQAVLHDDSKLLHRRPLRTSDRRPHGIQVTRLPVEHYNKVVERQWQTILQRFACALLSQKKIEKVRFWRKPLF